MVDQASPVTWSRGERNPVKVQSLENLRTLYTDIEAASAEGGTELRAAAGGAVLRVSPDGSVTIEVLPHTDVTVRTVSRPGREQYYTPPALVQQVIEHALADVPWRLDRGEGFTVCDSCVGSGEFITVTAKYIAKLQQQRDKRARHLTELLGSDTVHELETLVSRRLAEVRG
ncbi:hypothetical protein ACIRL3_45925 [Streptomyces sp. NPDC102384]|uniref:hypothetical protein n=1 Tax=Streptomyces sp. NPDC102384 TaxID=3366166 RepID=UPI00382B297E